MSDPVDSLAEKSGAPLPASSSMHSAVQDVRRETSYHADLVYISLASIIAIVLTLLVAVGMPVFNAPPVKEVFPFVVMVVASLAGIGYFCYANYQIHLHVSTQARLTEVLVNSLGQGFLSFDLKGECGRVYSQACMDLLEGAPARKNIRDVLRVPESERSDFNEWLDILYMPHHALGFDDVVKFLPQYFPHSGGRRISLVYRPVRDKEGLLTSVVVIATDQTEEFEAQKKAQHQQNYADMICRIFKERNQFMATLTQIRKFLESACIPTRREDAAGLLRQMHTLKAAVRHFHLEELGEKIHQHELELRHDSIKTDADFNVALQKSHADIAKGLADVLEQVRDLIGQDYEENRGSMHEVEESVLYDFAREMKARRVDPLVVKHFLSRIAAVPVFDCFKQFDRELKDLAEINGKQLKPLRYTGSNPRVLTQPIHDFLFSLNHICRNIIDHGIEPSVTRLARGKDPAGQVSVHCDLVLDSQSDSEWLQIVIADDGNGVDPAKVRAKLSSLDPQGPWRNQSDQDVIQNIFSWGFSTRDNVTDLSGHGVGMEAVEREVKLLGGTIRVYSELYRGTRFDIRIPYILDLTAQDGDSNANYASIPVLQRLEKAID